MGASEFIPLSREGIIRFQVVPETRMAVKIAEARLELPMLHLKFSGTSVALPHRTPVQVLASAGGGPEGPSSAVTVPLSAPGSRPGVATPVDCSLAATIDLVACEAIGRRGVLDLALTPNFPRTEKMSSLRYALDLECRIAVETMGTARIGSPVTLTPVVGEALAAAHLRLTLKEVDAGEEAGKVKDGQPTTQIRWEGGLTGLTELRRRTWYVGCASESQELEYPQAGEAGSYEFAFELEVSFDGETFHPIASAGQQLAVQRPRLAAFAVAQPGDDELTVRVQVDGIDPAFALPVNLELWKVGSKKAVASRRCSLLGGGLAESFTGLRALGLRTSDTVFALLSLAPEAAARPVASASHWLDFDADQTLPGQRFAAWVRSEEVLRIKLAAVKKVEKVEKTAGAAKRTTGGKPRR